MFSTVISILRWLWPFFKESLFQNESFKSWAKNNVRLCIWIGLWAMMAFAMVQMADLVGRQTRDITAMAQEMDTLKRRDAENLQNLTFSRLMVQSLAQELTWSRKTLPGHQLPLTCPIPATPPLQPTKKTPRKSNKNATLIDALQEWDRQHPKGLSSAPPLTAPTSLKP